LNSSIEQGGEGRGGEVPERLVEPRTTAQCNT